MIIVIVIVIDNVFNSFNIIFGILINRSWRPKWTHHIFFFSSIQYLNLHLFIIASGSGSNRTDRISLINFDFFLVLKTIRSVCFIALYSVDHQLDMQLWFIFIYLGLNLSNRQRYSKKTKIWKIKILLLWLLLSIFFFFFL